MKRSVLLLSGAGLLLVAGVVVFIVGLSRARSRGDLPHLSREEAIAWGKLSRSFLDRGQSPVYLIVRRIRTRSGHVWAYAFDLRTMIMEGKAEPNYRLDESQVHRGPDGLITAIDRARNEARRPENSCVVVVDLFSGKTPQPVWWGQDVGRDVDESKSPPSDDLARSLAAFLAEMQRKSPLL